MRRVKVWRYYCEYCGKGGCSGGHMKRHEERCTLNPNRVCGFHNSKNSGTWYEEALIEEDQVSIERLRAYLRQHVGKFNITHDVEGEPFIFSIKDEVLNDIGHGLLDLANGCPACALAAIRQENKAQPLPLFYGAIDYHKVAKEIFAEANERSRDY